MPKQQTASSAYAKTLLQIASSTGLDSRRILNESGIQKSTLEDPDARIPFDNFLKAWHCAIELSGNPCLGWDASALFHPSTYGPLSCVIMMTPNLGEAALQIIRFEHLPETATNAGLGFEDGLAYIELEGKGYEDEFIRPIIEYALVEPLYIARFITAQEHHAQIKPAKIYFKHANPNPSENFDERLNAPVYFSQPYNRAYFDPNLLAIPTHFSDASLYKSVLEKIEEIGKPNETSFGDKVREFIVHNLPNGVPSIQDAAEYFHLSYRTLQRRLKEDGVQYKTMANEVRKELAVKLLKQNTVSISEIGFLLGFQEPTSFHKAFKKWFSSSPGEYRKNAVKTDSVES